jgi:hypothetical protein
MKGDKGRFGALFSPALALEISSVASARLKQNAKFYPVSILTF